MEYLFSWVVAVILCCSAPSYPEATILFPPILPADPVSSLLFETNRLCHAARPVVVHAVRLPVSWELISDCLGSRPPRPRWRLHLL
ncbi:hypothetical protein B0T21DRAFT_356956 [Apiosordaria backusii]|uniref:Secreted protein n=1 Tax=Apiosordaria backusii TaxID=314023 RepID=A0AA40F029_9PEZI|nr:hypothetical protein B0T21DRAFT_356956 [Apiosordaria backusii]